MNRELCVLKLAFRLSEIPKPQMEMLKESDPRSGFFDGWRKSEALTRQMRHVDFDLHGAP